MVVVAVVAIAVVDGVYALPEALADRTGLAAFAVGRALFAVAAVVVLAIFVTT